MTYVMSDIHGNWQRFCSVLRQIKLTKNDHLYVLGDLTDRGADGLKILWKLMHMKNVTVLLGNHDYMMRTVLAGMCGDLAVERWYRNGGEVTHRAWGHYRLAHRQEMMEFLHKMPLNLELTVNGRDYLLVHGAPAAWYDEKEYEYQDATEYAVWKRLDGWEAHPQGKTIIFGHTPTVYYQEGKPMRIWYGNEGKLIGIDCGCAYGDMGRLACLRLDDMAEFYSEN